MGLKYQEWKMARKDLISKIQPFIKNGHIPHRGNEPYSLCFERIDQFWNCFGHACFNFTNAELFQLDVNYWDSLILGGERAWASARSRDGVECELEDFLGETGLGFNECEPEANLKNNQWKVALFFSQDWGISGEYHFLLQEKDGTWSAKNGFANTECFYDTLEEKVKSNGELHFFHKTFAITNPFVKEK